jgi:hypothetical protein
MAMGTIGWTANGDCQLLPYVVFRISTIPAEMNTSRQAALPSVRPPLWEKRMNAPNAKKQAVSQQTEHNQPLMRHRVERSGPRPAVFHRCPVQGQKQEPERRARQPYPSDYRFDTMERATGNHRKDQRVEADLDAQRPVRSIDPAVERVEGYRFKPCFRELDSGEGTAPVKKQDKGRDRCADPDGRNETQEATAKESESGGPLRGIDDDEAGDDEEDLDADPAGSCKWREPLIVNREPAQAGMIRL